MAPITINRGPWNALIDDSGGNLDGTPWTKDQIKQVLLDPIDAALAAAAGLALPNVFTANQRIAKARPMLEALNTGGSGLARFGQIVNANLIAASNLSHDGTNWNADDPTLPAALYYQSGGAHQFYGSAAAPNPRTNLVTMLAINPANNVVLPQGQITFPAVQNPSTDPNTFDDYEEGLWTPAVLFGGAAVGMVYNEQKGWYVKIGGWIWAGLRIILGNKGSSVGSATITGLPFADRDGGNVGGNFNYFGAMNAGVANMPSMYITNATITPALGAAGGIIIMDNTSFNPGSLIGALMYRTPT